MTNGKRKNREAVRTQILDHSADIESMANQLASLYLDRLERLVDLEADLSRMAAADHDLQWKDLGRRVARTLTIAEEQVRALDAASRALARCLGGNARIGMEATAEMQAKTERVDKNSAVRMQMQRLAGAACVRAAIFDLKMPPGLTAKKEERLRLLLREGREEGATKSATYIPPKATAWAPQRGVEGIRTLRAMLQSREQISEIAHSLATLYLDATKGTELVAAELSSLANGQPVVGAPHPKDEERRIGFMRKFQSERLRLIDQVIQGILRCLGGNRRLLMEAVGGLRREPDEKEIEVQALLLRIADTAWERRKESSEEPCDY